MIQGPTTTTRPRRETARIAMAGVVVLLALGLGGCSASSAYLAIKSEADLVPYAQLTSLWAARPITTNYIPTRIGDGPIVNVAIHETGNMESDHVIVLIHGVFADHRAWRFVASALGDDYDLILIDLPGSGASDCPDPQLLGPDGYAPDAMAERVLQALEVHFADRSTPRQITLAAHSLGGMIAIRMMGSVQLRSRHEQILGLVDRMVLLSPADVEIINPPALFVQIAELTEVEIMLGDLTGLLMDRICQGTRDSFSDPEMALREEAETRYQMLTQRDTRLALQAVFTQTVPMRDGRPDWPAIHRVVADYANVDVPCLIVWGARDETLPVAMGYKLAAQLPNAQLHVVPNCMHSVHLEDPVLCANLIRDFIAMSPNSDPGDFTDSSALAAIHTEATP